jgi:glycosyltransferase involved in cell wall biosynthesis
MKNMFRKIVFATGIFPPDIGGPATYIEKLANELVQRRFEVSVITFSDNKIEEKYDFPVISIPRKYPKVIRYFIYFLKLLKLAKNKDVIYSQNQTSAGFPSVLVSKILKKRLILKVVGDAAWESYANRVGGFDNIEIFQRKKYDFFTELIRKIRNFVVKNTDKIITPSHYLKGIISDWGVSNGKIEVIYNALRFSVDLDVSKEQAQDRIEVKGDVVLSIGRLCSWKGFETLIDIIPDLLKENPNFKLVIVGEGEERKSLEEKIKKLGLENNVKLTGRVLHKNIPLYFKSSEIFILNSEYEGLSHVILEAMQTGVPIIVSNRGGNPEIIENNFNGFLVEYNNKEQIRKAIMNLHNDKELQKTFIRNSKEKLEKFNWENLINKTIKILTNK